MSYNQTDRKVALITGVNGQDGSYLSEFLLDKGYEVWGMKRRSSMDNTARLTLAKQNPKFHLIEGDVTDPFSVTEAIHTVKPTEIYNTAAQSHVHTSFAQPQYTFQVNVSGVLNILEAVRALPEKERPRILTCSTSEMFGSNWSYDDNESVFQDRPGSIQHVADGRKPTRWQFPFQIEETPLSPNSPYAVSKVAAHQMVDLYRKSYGLHASCSVCFNHESPRRGEEFVTRKITKWLGDYIRWRQQYADSFQCISSDSNDCINVYGRGPKAFSFPKLRLGNLDASRDWAHAKDMVRGMWLMLQQEKADDYVLATGETHTIREFLDEAFGLVGLKWEDYVVIDPAFYRPCEVPYLRGDARKAQGALGWKPTISFKELVKEMVDEDFK